MFKIFFYQEADVVVNAHKTHKAIAVTLARGHVRVQFHRIVIATDENGIEPYFSFLDADGRTGADEETEEGCNDELGGKINQEAPVIIGVVGNPIVQDERKKDEDAAQQAGVEGVDEFLEPRSAVNIAVKTRDPVYGDPEKGYEHQAQVIIITEGKLRAFKTLFFNHYPAESVEGRIAETGRNDIPKNVL